MRLTVHDNDGPSVQESASRRLRATPPPSAPTQNQEPRLVLPSILRGGGVAPIGASIGLGYHSGAGVLSVPDFPAYLRNTQPRADGQPGARSESEPYNVEWVKDRALRAFRLQHDAVMQFSNLVAARTGAKPSNYWTASAGDEAMIESLVSNTIGADTLRQGAAANETRESSLEAILKKREEHLREAFKGAYDVGSAEFIRKMTDSTALDRSSTAALANAGVDASLLASRSNVPDKNSLSRDQAFQSADFQRITATYDAAVAQRAAPRPAAPAAKPPGRDLSEPMPSSGVPVARNAYDEFDYGPDSTQQRPFSALRSDQAPAPARANLSSYDQEAAEVEDSRRKKREEEQEKKRKEMEDKLHNATSLATVDSRGNVIEGITNPWLSLLRLMYNKPTDTELKMWRVLWDIPEPPKVSPKTERESSLDTLEGRRKYLENLKLIQSLIGKSANSGADWSEAPQHTGVVFFSPILTGGIVAALQIVRGLCGKRWALEIDLMVHEEVRSQFADLVAYCITNGSHKARYPQSPAIQQATAMTYRKLVALFKKLIPMSDGTLGFDGITDPAATAYRREMGAKRRAYVEEHGHYFGAE